MTAPLPDALRREIDRAAFDAEALVAWLVGAIVRAARVPEAQLQVLCDAVLAMIESLTVEAGGSNRVAVEVDRDRSCLALRVLGLRDGQPARSELLLWSA